MRELEELFVNTYESMPDYEYVSPARINLIGEHIDYNGGKVLPCAISYFMTGLYSFNKDKKIVAYSNNFDSKFINYLTRFHLLCRNCIFCLFV